MEKLISAASVVSAGSHVGHRMCVCVRTVHLNDFSQWKVKKGGDGTAALVILSLKPLHSLCPKVTPARCAATCIRLHRWASLCGGMGCKDGTACQEKACALTSPSLFIWPAWPYLEKEACGVSAVSQSDCSAWCRGLARVWRMSGWGFWEEEEAPRKPAAVWKWMMRCSCSRHTARLVHH